MSTTTITKLEALLQREKAAVLTGDFQAIASILSEKERLISGEVLAGLTSADLTRLKGMAARNERLLKGALSGIRSVQERVFALSDPGSFLTVYGPTGLRAPLRSVEAPSIVRKL